MVPLGARLRWSSLPEQMTGGAPAAMRAKVWSVIFYAALGLTMGQGPVTPQAFGNLGFGPILRPGELAGGQSVPLCNVTYRMLGPGELSALSPTGP